MTNVISIQDLMGVGAHFGHRARRWNPKMKKYIFTKKSGMHIMDLRKTLPLFVDALNKVEDIVGRGGRLLFVGTKRQASKIVREHAQRSGQYYINKRWLGGTLTNWNTISASIKRLKALEAMFEKEDFQKLPKKERLSLHRDHDKLENALGGIKDMGNLPDIVFVIDTNKEAIAVAEAKRMNIPIVAILDSNSTPDGITYPVPANDDAARAIEFYCHYIAEAALSGIKKDLGHRLDKKKAQGTTDKPEKKESAAEQVVQELAVSEIEAEMTGAPEKKAENKPLVEPAAEKKDA